jgi:hypothetical protein
MQPLVNLIETWKYMPTWARDRRDLPRRKTLSTNYKERGKGDWRHAGVDLKKTEHSQQGVLPGFSVSSASERKVFRVTCLIERISFVIGFF